MDNKSLLIRFGQNVRKLRQEQDISQEILAELSNLHRTYIGGIERGERNVALVNIVKIAQALGVDPAELLEGIGDKS